MKNTLKRALCLALVLVLGLSLMPLAPVSAAEPQKTNFTDIEPGAFYEAPVAWAVEKNITSGTSPTTFSPMKNCTRADVVTFLWRTEGKPAPQSAACPFTDVQPGTYYYDAVLWAVEKGITNGVSATSFGTTRTVTRGHFVTFLYRAKGKPAVSGTNPFRDVEAGQFYTQPILWAVSNGIAKGISETTFEPDTACNRGAVVTFLHRAYVPQGEKITLKVWGNEWDLKNTDGFLHTACAQFDAAHPEWDINFIFEAVYEGEVGNRVNQDPDGVADVYAFANSDLNVLLDAGAISPIGGALEEQVKADNAENIVASLTRDGKLYGVPFTGNTWFMYYDKSVYTEEDIKCLDVMMEKKPVAFDFENNWYLPAFYFATGGSMFGPYGMDASAGIQFGGENGAAASLYVANALASGTLADGSDDAGMRMLGDGLVGATFSGSWNADRCKEILGDNYGAAQLPGIMINGELKQLKSFVGSRAYGVNPKGENLEAATALAAWLGSPEMQDLHFKLRGGDVVPCSAALIASGKYDSLPEVVAQYNTIANTSVLQPSIPEMVYYWMNANTMIDSLRNGEINAENAREMTDAWNDSLNVTNP